MKWFFVSIKESEISKSIVERFIVMLYETTKPWAFMLSGDGAATNIYFGSSEEDTPFVLSALNLFQNSVSEIERPVEFEKYNTYYVVKQKMHFSYPIFVMDDDSWKNFDPLISLITAINEVSKNSPTFLLLYSKGLSPKEEFAYKKEIYKEAIRNKKKMGYSGIITDPAYANLNLRLKYSKGEVLTENSVELKRMSSLFKNILFIATEKEIKEDLAGKLLSIYKKENSLFGKRIPKELAMEIIQNDGEFKKTFKTLLFNPYCIFDHRELSGIIHLPAKTTTITATVSQSPFKQLSIPANMPEEGETIGVSVSGTNKKEVKLTKEMLERNIFAIGNSGFGKSTLAITTFIQAIKTDPNGTFVFYDPHGDATKQILRLIPEDKVDNTILLNAEDTEYPFTYSILNSLVDTGKKKFYKKFEDKYFVFDPDRYKETQAFVSQLVDILKIVSLEQLDAKDAYAFGARSEEIYNHVFSFFISLIYVGGLPIDKMYEGQPVMTFFDAIDFLGNDKIRETILSKTHFYNDVDSKAIREFFYNSLPNVILGTQKQKSEALSAALNKIRNAVPVQMRAVSCNIIPKFKIGEFLKPGNIILINVPASLGSRDAQILLSTALLSNIHFEITKRKENERNNVYIFIDESDTISEGILESFLAKDRKFGAHVFLNFQTLKQVSERTLDAILANVNSIFAFRSSGLDGEILEKEFAPYLTAPDFTQTPQYYAYTRIPIKGKITKPFIFKAIPMTDYNEEVKERIIKRTRELICTPANEVKTSFIYILERGLQELNNNNNNKKEDILQTIKTTKEEKKKETKDQKKKATDANKIDFSDDKMM